MWPGPVLTGLETDTARRPHYSVTCRPSDCLQPSLQPVMTVLEQEKTVSTMSDRYITPEYLAHLPTSVSTDRLTHLALSEIPTTHFQARLSWFYGLKKKCSNEQSYMTIYNRLLAGDNCPYKDYPRTVDS